MAASPFNAARTKDTDKIFTWKNFFEPQSVAGGSRQQRTREDTLAALARSKAALESGALKGN